MGKQGFSSLSAQRVQYHVAGKSCNQVYETGWETGMRREVETRGDRWSAYYQMQGLFKNSNLKTSTGAIADSREDCFDGVPFWSFRGNFGMHTADLSRRTSKRIGEKLLVL